MYLDKQNLFSYAQAVTTTANATSTIDLGPGDTGPSERISLFATADAPITGATALVVELQTADAVDGTGALTSPVTVATFPIPAAVFGAGGKLMADRLPHGLKRYAGVKYTVTGTAAGGKLTTGLVFEPQAWNPAVGTGVVV